MNATGRYPATRLRRLRQNPWLREMVREHRLHPSDLIWPVFVQEGEGQSTPVASLPGVSRHTIDALLPLAKEARSLGIPALALFPVVDPGKKSEQAEEAYNRDNLICRTVKALKDALPELGIICDVALDPYTSHGQDGLVEQGEVVNDPTVEVLCRQALCLAEAGCDIVAPSDMMDGRIGAIRAMLDEGGQQQVSILAYAAKYASAFYGPFRDAVGSSGNLGKADKQTYQMDPANSAEALREIALDIEEGADMVMVKPGLPYLDVVVKASDAFSLPVLAYQVSGEYAMLQAASAQGMLQYDAVLMESLLAFKRAGARAVLSYGAVDAAKLLQA